MSLRLTFHIEMESDYHVGAGHGRGPFVDSALLRDADGLPVLRGTTLTGLLRDGLYRLLELAPLHHYVTCQASGLQKDDRHPRFCGQRDPRAQDCPACRLFGSPRTSKRWRISSARPSGLPLPLKEKEGWPAGATGSQVVPHVRVSPRTRRAAPQQLFTREEGDARLVFQFTAVCDAEDENALDEAAWLVAAARYVRHIGASRRRGRGSCAIHLVAGAADTIAGKPMDDSCWEEWLLDRFDRRLLHADDPCPADAGSAAPLSQPDDAEQDPDRIAGVAEETLIQPNTSAPVRLLVVARLDEPLVVSERAVAGNEFRSLPFVPGPALRGAIAGRAAVRHNLDAQDGVDYKSFVRLFFRDTVRFSPLYPAHQIGNTLYPTIPTPLDLLSCELYPGFNSTGQPQHQVARFALRDRPEDRAPECAPCQNRKTPLKPLGEFISPYLPYWDRDLLRWRTEMHVHIDPETRRAASSDLFSFYTLPSGLYMVGEIVCRDEATWTDFCRFCELDAALELKKPTGLTLRLGKANRRGYGQATLWLLPQPHPWCPLAFEQRVADPTAPLILTLLTDAIVPDRWGRFRADLDAVLLAEFLGGQVCPAQVKVRRAFCAGRVVDSFNAHMGLPRWRDMALRAGSAVGFQVEIENLAPADKQALLERLRAVEEEGIGLRRGEGFGQVVFNYPFYDDCAPPADVARQVAVRLDDDGRCMAPAVGGPNHALAVEFDFHQGWAEEMALDLERCRGEDDTDPFAYPEFAALARLLRAEAPAALPEAEKLLARLGHFDELLSGKTLQELGVRAQEAARQNFFAGDKAAAGLQALRTWLAELDRRVKARTERLPEQDWETTRGRCWRIGLELLADRIAAVARKEEA